MRCSVRVKESCYDCACTFVRRHLRAFKNLYVGKLGDARNEIPLIVNAFSLDGVVVPIGSARSTTGFIMGRLPEALFHSVQAP